jgi:hypothetical protein
MAQFIDTDILDLMSEGKYDDTLIESADMFIVDQHIEDFREATYDLMGGSMSFDEAADQILDV